MKVKNKLRLGFGFLFVVVLLFGMITLFYINEISNSAKVILKDNYESLNFTRDMRTVLDEQDLPLNAKSADYFNAQLIKEEHNITEAGEADLVKSLRNDFIKLQDKTATPEQLKLAGRDARRRLRDIDRVNMRAIVLKNDKAHESVKHAGIFMGLAGTLMFLILFSFSVNFPGFISDPLNSLLDGIREIARKNYQSRIHFDKNDEFAEVANAFNEMALRLDEWENSNISKIMSDKQRIETIIEQMHDAIIGVDENQHILFINSAAKNILGLKEASPEGKSVELLARDNDLFKSIVQGDQTGLPFKIFADGKDSHFQLETRKISVPNLSSVNESEAIRRSQMSAGIVYVLKNITEFKERDEAKTNFIATISHELKTPISAIKMSAKLLADARVGHLNTEQQQLVEHITGDAERLLKITYELLDLSQVETGNIQLNFVVANPAQIIEYAVKAVKFEADQKGLIIEQHIAGNIPNINADVEKTAWVMINFLSNALRYSHTKSKILVNVTREGDKVNFSVQDFGKGIDPQYQERLFDRYFQVPTDGQNKSGSGLGLAISKEFIMAQGGDIHVESEVGVGSRFYFNLPVAEK
ncbi:ATP-binding protein [Mucilaginibacter ximonensis]|uniref:histidine kinase n=1 Tax=Mucilaginibacter ximonensis TaxID=538021 RepID=A0ABW5YFS6_9SPHI